MSKTDNIYATPQQQVESFRFDDKVVEVFPDMIKRSVPGYTAIIEGIGQLAHKYVKPNTYVYDLGCSLGAATLAIRQTANDPSSKVIAVDNSTSMIERCKLIQSGYNFSMPVDVIEADITELDIQKASMVVLNFTLQFLPIEKRQELIDRIYNGMVDGGILILSEKLTMASAELDEHIIDIHHDFKKSNGYSDMEIAQKRAALENVLIPDTREEHYARFKSAGFKEFDTWFQHYNFASFIAVK